MKLSGNFWLGASLAVAITLGFVGGRLTSQPGGISATQGDGENQQLNGSASRPATRTGKAPASSKNPLHHQRGSRDVRQTIKTLINRLERSPMGNMDFDEMFEVWEITRDFSEAEVREALLSLEDLKNPQLRMTLQMMLMNRWGKINGEAAMLHALDSKNSRTKMVGVMGVFMSWTKENPEAAFDWYETHQDKLNQGGGVYGDVYNGMIYQALARHNLTRALTQAATIENSQKRQTALASIAQGVANQPEKLKTFLKFLDNENEPSLKSSVMESVIGTMVMQDPESAKALIGTIDDSQEKAKLTEKMIRNWSYIDPEAAIEWGMKKTDDKEAQAGIITDNLGTWASQDPAAAGKWYDQQPDDIKTQDALTKVVRSLSSRQQYQEAFAWANRGSDPEKRAASKKDIYQSWLKQSPDAAKTWAEGEGRETLQGIDLTPAAILEPEETMPHPH